MKVYLAAPYGARDIIRGLLPDLADLDIVCTSSWLSETHDINDGTTGAALDLDDTTVSGHATQDLDDINDSDALVLFTSQYLKNFSASGGRHVETGYALARGLHVIVIGPPENVFHCMRNGAVELAPDWHAALLALQQWQIRNLRNQLSAERAS
jgi:hypothetical protein